MVKYSINIGLENNPFDDVELQIIIKSTLLGYIRAKVVDNGEYKGEPERTLVIRGWTKANYKQFDALINYLNVGCTQECIPYRFDGIENLKYNPDYVGEKLVFDSKYFLEY